MANGNIEFECIQDGCGETVGFSLLSPDKDQDLRCDKCSKVYHLDAALVDKLKKFETLVLSVKNAKDILGNTYVGVTVNEKSVKIPYRLLLTRMNTMVDLKIGDQTLTMRFRVEPLQAEEIKTIH